MHVGLGQPAEAPTQTIERVEKALATLQSIERFACDQHDHVSFAMAWMLWARESRMPWIMIQASPIGGDGPAATTLGRMAEADDVGAPWK